jgi:hypothetical protein
MTEHRSDTEHNTDFKNICILDKATGYTDCVIKEATDMRFHPKNFKRDWGFTLC